MQKAKCSMQNGKVGSERSQQTFCIFHFELCTFFSAASAPLRELL
jgi:hypothetical protein